MNSVMDERGVGGNEFHTNQILNAIEGCTDKMKEMMQLASGQGGFKSNCYGVAEGGDMYNMNSDGNYKGIIIEDENEDGYWSDCDVSCDEQHRAEKRQKVSNAKSMVKKRHLTMGYHHGKLQVLPVYFKFPNMTIKQLIDNWFIGSVNEKIPPFALLENNHVAHISSPKSKNSGRAKLRQMRSVMKVIRKYAEKEGCWTDDKSKWDVDYTSTMWNKIGEKYINAKFAGRKRRNAELSWKTVYNKMVKAKEFS